jgi:hypothetical protein
MTRNEQRETSTRLAERTFRNAERRLKQILDRSPNEERAVWRLYNFFHCAQRLTELRNSAGDETPGQEVSSAQMKLVAAQCHEALDTLLEAIGIRAEHKEWVLGQLTLQLRGLSADSVERQFVAHHAGPKTGFMLERASSRAVHSSEVLGEVIEHTDKAMIVRFDLDGLREERSFMWDEVSVGRDEVPVGTKVAGLARLVKAAEGAEPGDSGKAAREIHEAVEREVAELGPEAGKSLSREISSEERARALEDWKRIMSRSPDNEHDGAREG